MINIDDLKKMNSAEHYAVTEHAKLRLSERGIKLKDVINCIENGEILEQYETDKPLPSCLVLGLSIENKYLHAVVSHDDEFIYLITAYYPNLTKWNSDYKTRRE